MYNTESVNFNQEVTSKPMEANGNTLQVSAWSDGEFQPTGNTLMLFIFRRFGWDFLYSKSINI